MLTKMYSIYLKGLLNKYFWTELKYRSYTKNNAYKEKIPNTALWWKYLSV